MERYKAVAYVKEHLPKEEILCQLAEEAAELAQAALKMHRVLDSRNPTPVTAEQAWNQIFEEYGDLRLCIEAVSDMSLGAADERADIMAESKYPRWVCRIKSAAEQGEVKAADVLEASRSRFKKEIKQLVRQKCEEINHYVSGCDSPFTYMQIADTQESLRSIEDILEIGGKENG